MLMVVLLLLLLSFASAVDVDVCVIGAGAAGVQAAYAAEEAGLTTALFEKIDYIGGKTKTVEYGGRTYPMGAVLDQPVAQSQYVGNLIQEFKPRIPATFEGDNRVIADGELEDFTYDQGILGNINFLRYTIFFRIFNKSWMSPMVIITMKGRKTISTFSLRKIFSGKDE